MPMHKKTKFCSFSITKNCIMFTKNKTKNSNRKLDQPSIWHEALRFPSFGALIKQHLSKSGAKTNWRNIKLKYTL